MERTKITLEVDEKWLESAARMAVDFISRVRSGEDRPRPRPYDCIGYTRPDPAAPVFGVWGTATRATVRQCD